MRDRRRVDVWELRRIFNATGLIEHAGRGELYLEVLPVHPADPTLGLPAGTMSRLTWYHELKPRVHRVALVHQMVYPDGKISKPDPKWLLVGDEILIPAPRAAHPPV